MGEMTQALNGAKLVGYKDNAICVWYGGYGFNIYKATSWKEVDYFSSGALAEDRDNRAAAIETMEDSGYEVVN